MGSARRFILVPVGSAGDMNPFAWLAEGLAAAGHEVSVVVHAPFGRLFQGKGTRVSLYGSSDDYDQVTRHPDLWHPRRAFALIARMSERFYRHAVPLIEREISRDRTTLVGAGIAFGARVAAEAFGLPLVTVQLQPAAIPSLENPPILRAGWEWFPRAPRIARALIYRLGWWYTDWLLADGINTFRAELGLGVPVRRVMRDYWMSPNRVLALFPEWFCPRPPDWPSTVVTSRFPLYDGMKDAHLHPSLDAFLSEAAPPLVFSPGSANRQAQAFFEVAAEASRTLGFRTLLVTPFAAQIPKSLPPGVRHVESAPFSRLLPRCRLLIHHGGIGTTAQALAAGIPQLIMPLSHDQPDNADRVRRLGVGDRLYPAEFTVPKVVEAIRRLTGSKDTARSCHGLADRLRHQMPREQVVRLVEEIV